MLCHFSLWCLMSLQNFCAVFFSFAPPSLNTSSKTSVYGLSRMTAQILGVQPRLSNSRSLTASIFFEIFNGRAESLLLSWVSLLRLLRAHQRQQEHLPEVLVGFLLKWQKQGSPWNNCALVITNTEVKETEGTFNLSKIWHRTICFSC